LVISFTAFHAVGLFEAVIAVVVHGAWLTVEVSTQVGAQTAVRVTATFFGGTFVLKASAATVHSKLGVCTAVTDVGKAIAGGKACAFVDVEVVVVRAGLARVSITATVAVVHAGHALSVRSSTDVVATLADLAHTTALASGAVITTVVLRSASTVDNVEAAFATVALVGTALQAVVTAGVASASFSVKGETVIALVATISVAFLAVFVVASSASCLDHRAVVSIHATLAHGGCLDLVRVWVDSDASSAGRAAVNVALVASGVVIDIVTVHAFHASISVVTVAAVGASVDLALSAFAARVAVNRVTFAGGGLDCGALGVNAAAAAVALVIVECGFLAGVEIPAVGQGRAGSPCVAIGLVVPNVASSAETLPKAVGTVVEVVALVVVEQSANSIVATAHTPCVAASILGRRLVTGASAAVVHGGAAIAHIRVDLFLGRA